MFALLYDRGSNEAQNGSYQRTVSTSPVFSLTTQLRNYIRSIRAKQYLDDELRGAWWGVCRSHERDR